MLGQCSISIPSENVRKPEVFSTFSGGIEMKHLERIEIEKKCIETCRNGTNIFKI